MSIVALDTMVLVWGLRRKAPSSPRGSKDLQRRAKILLRQLEEDNSTIVIPTVVVAELLIPVNPDKHGDFIAELQHRFICPPVDLQAASLAAKLWQAHRGLPDEDQVRRRTLKADALIVAAARVAGATVFYSHDQKCRRLAKLAELEARDLPTHHENLFIDKEIGNGGKET